MEAKRFGWPAALVAAAAMALAGCSAETSSEASLSPTPTGAPAESASTVEPTNPLDAVLIGDWRRVPVDPKTSSFLEPVDAACRTAEPRIGDLPIATADARGHGRLVVIYAGSSAGAAWECLAPATTPGPSEVVVTAIQGSADPIAADAIDAVDYRIVDIDGQSAVVLVGRVGASAVKVISQFDGDESYIYASVGNGWYAMWWPGIRAIGHLSSTDIHNLVITGIVPTLP